MEAARVFSYLETKKKPRTKFNHLLVGQFNLRPELERLIDFEINEAKKGRPSGITIKVNSLQDRAMVERLYNASKAGVPIKIIARGICCLIPGIRGLSDKIKVISIVDRFLEHARVFHFHHAGEDKVFVSSADWMTRNLSFRVETVFPIYTKKLKQQVLDIIDLQWSDNVKSRIIDKRQANKYKINTTDMPIRSQLETYFYYKRLQKKQ